MKGSTCVVCGLNAQQHASSEEAREVQHEFSVDGKLVAINWKGREKDEALRKQSRLPDYVLRVALLEAGVITSGQIAAAAKMLSEPLFASKIRTGSTDDPPRNS